MKLYIYDIENGDLEENQIVVDTIEGETNFDCELEAETFFSDTNRYAWSYACAHESITTPDGHGAYCKYCGETVA